MRSAKSAETWRLLYSPRKLSPSLRNQLSALLEDFTYTCGATLSDLELPDALSDVCVRDLQCYDHLEEIIYLNELRSDSYSLLCRGKSNK